MSSRIVTVFSDQKIAKTASPSMFASASVHFMTVGILFVLMKLAVPHVVHVPPLKFSVVRILTYNPNRSEARAGSPRMQELHAPGRIPSHIAKSSAGAARPRQRRLPASRKIKTGPQTLLQAHTNRIPPPKNAIIPTTLLAAAHPRLTQKIVSPQPHRNPAAPMPTTLSLPNAAIHVSNIRLSPAHLAIPNLPTPASTTVPYELDNPTTNAQIIETTSPSQQQPTPTRLLAISDLKAVKGIIPIPQTENEVQKTEVKGSAMTGTLARKPGTGKLASKGLSTMDHTHLASAGTTRHLKRKTLHAAAIQTLKKANMQGNTPSVPNRSNRNLATLKGRSSEQTLAGQGAGNHLSFTRLSKSATGRFGAVVMGDSSEMDFPETADLWRGRNVYTVYIDVGEPISWILQYALPKSATRAQRQGTLAAPYPYEMLRPNFAPSALNADDLLVHGFITAKGKLVDVDTEFPPNFVFAKAILQALKQWQFRPAKVDGKATRVEALLIIPNGPNG